MNDHLWLCLQVKLCDRIAMHEVVLFAAGYKYIVIAPFKKTSDYAATEKAASSSDTYPFSNKGLSHETQAPPQRRFGKTAPLICWVAFSCRASSRSWSTINLISSLNPSFGSHPSTRRALLASPSRRSTSAGR